MSHSVRQNSTIFAKPAKYPNSELLKTTIFLLTDQTSVSVRRFYTKEHFAFSIEYLFSIVGAYYQSGRSTLRASFVRGLENYICS